MTLFWRLFLAFWIALVASIAVAAGSTWYLLNEARTRLGDAGPMAFVKAYLAEAGDVYDNHGPDGLKHWLGNLERRESIPIYILDENGEDLLGRDVPDPDALHGPFPDGLHLHRGPGHGPKRGHGFQIHTSDNSNLRLLADFSVMRPDRMMTHASVVTAWVVSALLVSALMCYLLTRSLTTPLVRLQDATKRVADGELDYRVEPAVGPRRDELGRLARDFDLMSGKLEQLRDARIRLLRDVSHELRSPLARLRVALELARDKEGVERKEALSRIEGESEKLDVLIGEILTLSRLETLQPGGEQFSLDELLHSVIADARYEAQTGNITIDADIAEHVSLVGHPEVLRRAVENVVRNALRYAGSGATVSVGMHRENGEVLIRVRDNGPGIPEKELEDLFQPFVRGSNANRGYGLGLAIANRAVELHDGAIAAANDSSGGLRVDIRLPRPL